MILIFRISHAQFRPMLKHLTVLFLYIFFRQSQGNPSLWKSIIYHNFQFFLFVRFASTLQKPEKASTDSHWDAHNDTFRDSVNGVFFAEKGSFKKMVCGFLKGCQTLSFILAIPKRVIPRTSPLNVIRSARSITWRLSIVIPWLCIVNKISSMMVFLAASIPSVLKFSRVWFDRISITFTTSVLTFSPSCLWCYLGTE